MFFWVQVKVSTTSLHKEGMYGQHASGPIVDYGMTVIA